MQAILKNFIISQSESKYMHTPPGLVKAELLVLENKVSLVSLL